MVTGLVERLGANMDSHCDGPRKANAFLGACCFLRRPARDAQAVGGEMQRARERDDAVVHGRGDHQALAIGLPENDDAV